MKTKLLTEINRIREVMGLSIILEASGKGVWEILTSVPKYLDDIEKVAVRNLDELEYAAFQAVEGSAEKVEFDLVKKQIDEIAGPLGVDTSKTLSEIITDLNKLTGDLALQAQKKLLTFLNGKYDDIAQLTVDEIKASKTLRNSVNQGEISADAMREVLKELNIPATMVDDVVKTFYKSAAESASTAAKLGIKLEKGIELASDYVSAMESKLADNIFVSKYKKVFKDTEFLTDSFNKMVDDLTKQGKPVTKESVETWFNNTMAARLTEISKNPKISTLDKNQFVKLANFLLNPSDGITKIIEGNIATKGLGVLSLYAVAANWFNMLYGAYTALDINLLTSDKIVKEHFFNDYKNDTQVMEYVTKSKELKNQLKEGKITQDQFNKRNKELWNKIENLFSSWKTLNYIESATSGYMWPIYTYKAYKRKEGGVDDYTDAAESADAASKIETGENTGGGQTQSTIIDDVKVYLGKQTRKDNNGRDVPAYDLTDFTFEDLGNNVVKWTIKSTKQTGTLTKQSDGSFK